MIASTKKAREDVMTAVARALASVLALLCITAAAIESSAQSYPMRPVRMIVPFGAGGHTDVIARARAAADGYTMLVVSTGFMVNPSMYAKVPYDPVKDFAPVT